jgi:hypothetical protein
MDQAVQEGAQIINISGGQFSPSGHAHPLLADAVRNCADNGVLIVAAAGNQGCDCLHIPGAMPSVLAVGAMDSRGDPLEFSNWGNAYQSQGVLAPGEDILGAVPPSGTARRTGTSFATPIVSGVCALLLSLQHRRGNPANPKAVRAAILQSALGCEHRSVPDCRRLLAGRLNLTGAVSLLTQGIRTMTASPDATLQPQALAPDTTPTPVSLGAPVASVEPAVCAVEPSETGPPSPLAPVRGGALLAREAGLAAPDVMPSDCGCKGGPPQLVYALGKLGYDFGTEARRDWFVAEMSPLSPYNPQHLESYFLGDPPPWPLLQRLLVPAPELPDLPPPPPLPPPPLPGVPYVRQEKRVGRPEAAEALIWTLNLDATTIYAIQPSGPYAAATYAVLRGFLHDQIPVQEGGEGAERVAVPGYIVGRVRLLNKQVVPVIQPELRGLFDWKTSALIQALRPKLAQIPGINPDEEIASFLSRIYYEFRNLGTTSQGRALNYAGTVALLFARSLQSELAQGYHLDTIAVERSGICRPESDCWDIKLTFYNPKQQLEQSRRVHIFPIDVSDVIPVVLAPEQTFFVR